MSADVYYKTAEGDRYQVQTWYKTSAKEFEKLEGVSNIFEEYRVDRNGNTATVWRSQIVPSFDKFYEHEYVYENGLLKKVTTHYKTFALNLDDPEAESVPVEAVIRSDVERGKLVEKSRTVVNLDTGKEGNYGFSRPELKHWMKLSDLPKEGDKIIYR